MKNSMTVMAIALASGSALAGFDATYQSFTGVTGAFTINGTDYAAGHLNLSYDGAGDRGIGQFSGGNFSTFCIELQNVAGSSRSYDIVSLSDAPNPSGGGGIPSYDAADVAEVAIILNAAVALNWINADLSAGSAVSNDRLAAIQGHIWQSLFDGASFTVNNASVQTQMNDLAAQFDNSQTSFVGLHAMVNADTQDQLFIVPLPPAALAGLLTLGGLVGVKRLRRS